MMRIMKSMVKIYLPTLPYLCGDLCNQGHSRTPYYLNTAMFYLCMAHFKVPLSENFSSRVIVSFCYLRRNNNQHTTITLNAAKICAGNLHFLMFA